MLMNFDIKMCRGTCTKWQMISDALRNMFECLGGHNREMMWDDLRRSPRCSFEISKMITL